VATVREQDHRRSLGILGEVLRALLHRLDIVGVDPDRVLQPGAEAVPVGLAEGSQAVGERRDRRRVVEQLQVRAALVIPGLRRELDQRHRRVALHEIARQRVHAVGHPLQRSGKPGAVPRVVQDRRRVVKDDRDVGAIRGRIRGRRSRNHGRHEERAGDDDGGERGLEYPLWPRHGDRL
jgi:hypothetical protein